MSAIAFEEFPKIPRLKRECVITEKIDGSNAQVYIRPAANSDVFELGYDTQVEIDGASFYMRAGSRQRWIKPGKDTDNFGFAAWVYDHAHELASLGEGHHFGEWYGAGIQRGYGLEEKRFALFNTARWNPLNPNRPACCGVVPVVYTGPLGNADQALEDLRKTGSQMVPGYMHPEGIIVYHSASRSLFKQVIENDDVPKGAVDKGPRPARDPNKGGRRIGLTPDYAGLERRAA